MSLSPNQEAAFALASMGLHIFPCHPDKKPAVTAWEQSATKSALQIEASWQSKPHLLPAIPVGAHHLVVIDADRKPNGPDGVEAFQALCAAHSIDLSNAFVVETPSTGLHFYFRTEIPYGNSRGSLPDGVDVRGVGGYVVAPGATMPDGRSYRIVAGSWDTIPVVPEPLGPLLREKRAASPSNSPNGLVAPNVTDRERSYAFAALSAEIEKLSAMREGSGRNAALNQAAHSLATMEGWIDRDVVLNALFNASVANGYVAKDGERAAKQTIESGYEAGRLKPRPLISDVPNVDVSGIIAKPSPAQAKRSVVILQGTQIQMRRIDWLWDQFLPLGKLTLLAGVGGAGKSTIACSLAATVTTAGIWPDGTRCNGSGNVLIWSSEDDAADTLAPRLAVAGANPARYGVISGAIDAKGNRCPFDVACDMPTLREAVMSIGGISMLIIDPIVTAVTGDMNKANDVRRSLQTIVDFASEMNCAVIGITHFAKGTAGKNSAERVIGSTAFKDFSRMTLVAAKDEESNRRVFTRAKSNNSVDSGGFNYSIEAIGLPDGIIATRIVWRDALEGSSRSILNEIEGESEDASQLGAAKKFLIEVLMTGPAPSKELLNNAKEGFGISPNTLRKAQKELGIVATKTGFAGGWMWALPVSIASNNLG